MSKKIQSCHSLEDNCHSRESGNPEPTIDPCFRRDNDIELAKKVTDLYADGLDGLTYKECREISISSGQCSVLTKVLGKGKKGEVTDWEKDSLEIIGFSKTFIDELADSDGKKALRRRVRWLSDNAVIDYWGINYDEFQRVRMFVEARDTGLLDKDEMSVLKEFIKEQTLPALIKALDSVDWIVRKHAALALGEIGPAATEAVPTLIKVLDDEYMGVRYYYHEALGKIGPAAVPELINALGDKNLNVRYCITRALKYIGPAAAEAIPTLIKVLGDKNLYVRRSAKEALSKMGIAAVSLLIKALCDENSYVRYYAAEALGEIGPNAWPAIPQLEKMAILDPDQECRNAAKEALEKLRGKIR